MYGLVEMSRHERLGQHRQRDENSVPDELKLDPAGLLDVQVVQHLSGPRTAEHASWTTGSEDDHFLPVRRRSKNNIVEPTRIATSPSASRSGGWPLSGQFGVHQLVQVASTSR